jgi:Protein of unknown function (DUF3667)
MSNHHKQPHTPYCLNCHYPTAELDNFCPNCGQKPSNGKITMHDLLHEFLHNLTHFDGKIVSSLRHALIPGKLTLEFFKGHHKRYAHPIQLFLVIGKLYILLSIVSQNPWPKSSKSQYFKLFSLDKKNSPFNFQLSKSKRFLIVVLMKYKSNENKTTYYLKNVSYV